MYNKAFSWIICLIFSLNSVAFGSVTGKDNVYTAIVSQTLVPHQIETALKEYGSLKSWNDLKKVAKKYSQKNGEYLISKIQSMEQQPFVLPEVVKTETGFSISAEGTVIAIDLYNKIISKGDKKISFEGKSSEEVMKWLEGATTTTSFLSLFISEAYAGTFLIPFIGVIACLLLIVATGAIILHESSCSKAKSAIQANFGGTLKACEGGDYTTATGLVAKEVSAEKTINFASLECQKDLYKAVESIGIQCFTNKEIEKLCTQFNQISKCMKNAPPQAAINGTRREEKKEVKDNSPSAQELTDRVKKTRSGSRFHHLETKGE